MHNASRSWAVLGAVVVTCLVAWWLLPAPPDATQPVPTTAATPGEVPEDPTLIGGSGEVPSSKVLDGPKTPKSQRPKELHATIRDAKRRLAVRVVPPLVDGVADAEIECLGQPFHSDVYGVFDGDDTFWFALPIKATPESVRLSVDAHFYVPLEQVLALKDLATETSDSDQVTWRHDVTLKRSVIISGQVLDPTGAGAPKVEVLAYALHGSTVGSRVVTKTTTHGKGRFILESPHDTPLLLVAHTDALAPGSVRIAATSLSNGSSVVIRLRTGHRVRGILKWDGGAPEDKDWRVEYSCHADLVFAEKWYLAPDGNVERASGDLEVLPDGSFTIEGLASTTYAVLPSWHFMVDYSLLRSVGVEITLPHEEVVFDIRPAWLDLDVRMADERPEQISVSMKTDEGSWGTGFPAPWTKRSLAVLPGQKCKVAVGATGQAYVIHEITTPAAGQRMALQFDLEPEQIDAPLEVRFSTPGIPTTNFQLVAVDDTGVPRSGVASMGGTTAPVGNVFRIGAHVGRWRLTCHPGRDHASVPLTWMPVDQIVDVASAGTTVDIKITQGGLVRVHAKSSGGQPVPAQATLLGAGGKDRKPAWLTPVQYGWQVRVRDGLGADGDGWTEDPLPPGTYTLVVTHDGYQDVRRTVKVQIGKTTVVQVEMKRRD